MRLVVCPKCETQYDVSTFDAPELVCRCGTTVKNAAPQGVDALVVRCGACGAAVAEGGQACAYCRAEVVRTGPKSLICPKCYGRNDERSRFCTACAVEFRPEPPPLAPEAPVRCVRGCSTTACVPVAGILAHECPSCRGIWVPEDRIDDLVERIGRGSSPPPPAASGEPSSAARVEYRRCPVCSAQMDRRNFHRISGVVVDRCPKHGTWLDADELHRIFAFVSTGGVTRAAEREDLERARLARSAAFRARMDAGNSHRVRADFDVKLTRSFAGLVKKLLSGNLRGD